MLNNNGTQVTFNNQAGIDSLNFYTGFEKSGASVIPSDVGAGWAGDAFGKQRAAMALEGGWLIPYMTGKDAQTLQLHAGFALPSLISLANDPYFTHNPGLKIMFDAATYSFADNYGPHDKIIHDALADAIEKVLLGKGDSKTALNEAADEINNELQS